MDYGFLAQTPLFMGADAEEVKAMLCCLEARSRSCEKGELLCRAGERMRRMGLVVSGSVSIELDDVWGNRTILGRAEKGDLFAEAYACLPEEALMVNVTAAERSEVLFLDMGKLMTTCGKACAHHSRLIQNLLGILARKNLELSRRSLHTSPKTIRERLLSYLSEQRKRAGENEFTIPYQQQQLADYLGAERSALSSELNKMRREGILEYRKSHFTLYGVTETEEEKR